MSNLPINMTQLAASTADITYDAKGGYGNNFQDIMLAYADPNQDGVIDVKTELVTVIKTLERFDLFNNYDTDKDGIADDHVLTYNEASAIAENDYITAANTLTRIVKNVGGVDKVEIGLLQTLRLEERKALSLKSSLESASKE